MFIQIRSCKYSRLRVCVICMHIHSLGFSRQPLRTETKCSGFSLCLGEFKGVKGVLLTDIRWSWVWGERRVGNARAESASEVVCLVMLRFHINCVSNKGCVDKVCEGNEGWKWVFVHFRMFLYLRFLVFAYVSFSGPSMASIIIYGLILKGIVHQLWKFCHHFITLLLLQTLMTSFLRNAKWDV